MMHHSSLIRRFLCLALLMCLSAACQPAYADTDVVGADIYPGRTILFGFYEQDNNPSNGTEPVEWQVLDVDYNNDRVLLLSRHAIEMQRFNPKWTKVSWADCGLRSFLNSDFYSHCFSYYERQAIQTTRLTSRYVDRYVETVDNVFCLSAEEIKRYFPSTAQRFGYPTPYAVARETAVFENGTCYWWLRDTTKRQNDANRIQPNGKLEEYGGNTNAYGVGVRPAVWVRLSYFYGN